MKNRLFLTIIVSFIVLILTGCGQIKVTGKVAFSDGTPLTKGKVVFENSTNTYTSKIHEDGTFSMGVLKDGKGIPRGKYNVAIAEAFDEELPTVDKPQWILKHWIAEKFRSPKTSEIEYDIQKNTKNISIVVESPKPGEEKQSLSPLLPNKK